jgi:hypothetical protein
MPRASASRRREIHDSRITFLTFNCDRFLFFEEALFSFVRARTPPRDSDAIRAAADDCEFIT